MSFVLIRAAFRRESLLFSYVVFTLIISSSPPRAMYLPDGDTLTQLRRCFEESCMTCWDPFARKHMEVTGKEINEQINRNLP